MCYDIIQPAIIIMKGGTVIIISNYMAYWKKQTVLYLNKGRLIIWIPLTSKPWQLKMNNNKITVLITSKTNKVNRKLNWKNVGEDKKGCYYL